MSIEFLRWELFGIFRRNFLWEFSRFSRMRTIRVSREKFSSRIIFDPVNSISMKKAWIQPESHTMLHTRIWNHFSGENFHDFSKKDSGWIFLVISWKFSPEKRFQILVFFIKYWYFSGENSHVFSKKEFFCIFMKKFHGIGPGRGGPRLNLTLYTLNGFI